MSKLLGYIFFKYPHYMIVLAWALEGQPSNSLLKETMMNNLPNILKSPFCLCSFAWILSTSGKCAVPQLHDGPFSFQIAWSCFPWHWDWLHESSPSCTAGLSGTGWLNKLPKCSFLLFPSFIKTSPSLDWLGLHKLVSLFLHTCVGGI